jgi:anti-sigma factor RsiW
MDCDRVETLLNAYIDGELDLSSTLTLEAHLASCKACREHHHRLTHLVADLQAGLERYPAPADLRERLAPLGRSVRSEMAAADEPASGTAMMVLPPRRSSAPWRAAKSVSMPKLNRRHLLALAASIAGVAVVSGASTYFLARPGEGHEMAEEVVASHIRSLMASHLIDIASTDQHTVKPWFDGKVDVAPTVADYTEQGFSLIGGRLDYLDRRPVAALVYRHRAHLINMFACPVAAGEEHETKPESLTIHGYNVLYWTAGDVTYWAVSDVNQADLMTFRNLVEDASSHG